MEYGDIVGVGKRVSRLIQGAVMLNSEDRDGGFALFDIIYQTGCNTFDTAHVYGAGDSERVLGAWIADRGIREETVIITKGAHPNADRLRVTPFDIASDVHDSLARLGTDYIDLYLLHRDNPDVPVAEIVEAVNEHIQAGRIKAWGGSNWSHERIEAANAVAQEHGWTPMVASSPHFSLAEQREAPWAGCISISGPGGEAAREWYTKQQMPVLCWSSLSGGFFSGRYDRAAIETAPPYSDDPCIRCYGTAANVERLDRASELAREKGLTLPQIALAFVLNSPMNVYPLVGCATGDEFRANADVLTLKLTPEELDWLDLRRDQR